MLVSNRTIEILKNFHGINTGLHLRKGRKQTTISTDEDIFVEAQFDEEIPVELGIFDLQRFLGNLSNLEEPKIDFEKTIIKLSDKNTVIHYYSCNPELLVAPDEDMELSVDNPELTFSLQSSTLSKALKIAAINGSDRFLIQRLENKIYISLKNSKDNTANRASIFIEDNEGDDVTFTFRMECMSKIMSIDYNVNIEENLASFVSKDGVMKYFISEVED